MLFASVPFFERSDSQVDFLVDHSISNFQRNGGRCTITDEVEYFYANFLLFFLYTFVTLEVKSFMLPGGASVAFS